MDSDILLLDSQAALWVLEDNPRLGPVSRGRIADAARIYVSAATVWELTIKSMLGKLTIPEQLSQKLLDAGFAILPIAGEHGEAIVEFPELLKHDPFDRIILAQAYCECFTLLTSDKVLLALQKDYISDALK